MNYQWSWSNVTDGFGTLSGWFRSRCPKCGRPVAIYVPSVMGNRLTLSMRRGQAFGKEVSSRIHEAMSVHRDRCGSKVSPGPPRTAPDAHLVTLYGDCYKDNSGFIVVGPAVRSLPDTTSPEGGHHATTSPMVE